MVSLRSEKEGEKSDELTRPSRSFRFAEHAASWWTQKPKKHEDAATTETTVARERY